MKDHVSGHGTTLSVPGSPDHSRAARRKEEKEKAEDDPKGPEEHSLMMSKRKIPNAGKKRTQFGGPKERKARRACRKVKMASIRVVLALTSPTKEQARTTPRTKATERTKTEKARKEPFLNPDSQPQKHPMKKDMARPGNQTIGLPVTGLTIPGRWVGSAQKLILHGMVATLLNLANHPTHVVLDLGCTRSIGSIAAIERFKKHAGIMALRRNFALSCLPTPRQKPARKVALFTFQQLQHVQPRLMFLRQVMCPSCFPSLK